MFKIAEKVLKCLKIYNFFIYIGYSVCNKVLKKMESEFV